MDSVDRHPSRHRTSIASRPPGHVRDLDTRSAVHDLVVAFYREIVFDELLGRLLALERASMAIAVRLPHASAVAEAQERFAAISLEEFIAGHAGDTADVAERAISFGTLGGAHGVMLRGCFNTCEARAWLTPTLAASWPVACRPCRSPSRRAGRVR